MGWSLSSTLRLHSRVCPTRPLTSTMYCIRAGIVEEITFADGECDCWVVSTCTVAVQTVVSRIGHRATRDVRWTAEEQALWEAPHFRPGSKTSGAERLPEARRDVTMPVTPRGPEHKVLTYVYSGSVVRFRSACYGRPDPYAVAHPSLAGNGIWEVRVRQGSRKASLSRHWGCGVGRRGRCSAYGYPSRPQVAR